MIHKTIFGFAVVLAAGVAASASAQQIGVVDSSTFGVGVNINVQPVADLWAADDTIELVMQGNDGNNSATAASVLSHINNVPAEISATVTGTLPTPAVPGGGINFFIFPNEDSESDAVAAITGNAYNPAGALVWTQPTLNTTQSVSSVVAGPSIQNIPVVYASASPGELPAVGSYDLVVTFEIAPL